MRQKLIKTAFAFLTVLIQAAFAQPNLAISTHKKPWYQIEMIIFSQIPYAENDNEQWPYAPVFQQPANVIQLVPPQIYQLNDNQPNNLTLPLIKIQQFTLSKEELHISHNPNYRLIGHFGWLQPITSSVTHATHLQAANNQTHMDALIKLTKKNYIHVHLSAFFATQTSAFHNKTYINSVNNNGIVRFNIHKQFKMKLNELNYIDTPFYGVLIKITSETS